MLSKPSIVLVALSGLLFFASLTFKNYGELVWPTERLNTAKLTTTMDAQFYACNFEYGDFDGNHLSKTPCMVGEPDWPLGIMYIGNSHATNYWEYIRRLGKQQKRSILFYTSSTCLPLLNYKISETLKYNPALTQKCDAYSKNILPLLDQYPQITSVYSAARYDFIYTHNEDTQAPSIALHADQQTFLTSDEKSQFLAYKTTEFIHALAHRGKQLTILGQVPLNPHHLGVMRNVFDLKRTGDPHRFDQLAMNALKPLSSQQEIFIRLSEQYPNVQYVDPVDAFCKDARCVTVNPQDASKALYTDDQHLSGAGSQFLADQMLLNKSWP